MIAIMMPSQMPTVPGSALKHSGRPPMLTKAAAASATKGAPPVSPSMQSVVKKRKRVEDEVDLEEEGAGAGTPRHCAAAGEGDGAAKRRGQAESSGSTPGEGCARATTRRPGVWDELPADKQEAWRTLGVDESSYDEDSYDEGSHAGPADRWPATAADWRFPAAAAPAAAAAGRPGARAAAAAAPTTEGAAGVLPAVSRPQRVVWTFPRGPMQVQPPSSAACCATATRSCLLRSLPIADCSASPDCWGTSLSFTLLPVPA